METSCFKPSPPPGPARFSFFALSGLLPVCGLRLAIGGGVVQAHERPLGFNPKNGGVVAKSGGVCVVAGAGGILKCSIPPPCLSH